MVRTRNNMNGYRTGRIANLKVERAFAEFLSSSDRKDINEMMGCTSGAKGEEHGTGEQFEDIWHGGFRKLVKLILRAVRSDATMDQPTVNRQTRRYAVGAGQSNNGLIGRLFCLPVVVFGSRRRINPR